MDYALPRATDVPPLEVHHVVTPSPLNPLGVKGAGEGGTLPAPAAIANAVADALRPLRRRGDRDAAHARAALAADLRGARG